MREGRERPEGVGTGRKGGEGDGRGGKIKIVHYFVTLH